MSEPPFFPKQMGQQFYERTAPELVKQLVRLNDLLERLVCQLEAKDEEDRQFGYRLRASR